VDINLMDGRGEGNGGQRREREPKEGRRDKPPETSAPSDSRREERERGIVQLEQQTQSEKRKRKRENVRVSVDVDEVLELVEVVHGLMRSERKSRPTRAKSTNQAISVPRRPNFRSGREREREREREEETHFISAQVPFAPFPNRSPSPPSHCNALPVNLISKNHLFQSPSPIPDTSVRRIIVRPVAASIRGEMTIREGASQEEFPLVMRASRDRWESRQGMEGTWYIPVVEPRWRERERREGREGEFSERMGENGLKRRDGGTTRE